jgi:hypothetical protein
MAQGSGGADHAVARRAFPVVLIGLLATLPLAGCKPGATTGIVNFPGSPERGGALIENMDAAAVTRFPMSLMPMAMSAHR